MFEKIQAYLANQLDISPDDITPETTFESLGIDSLDMAELICDIEERRRFAGYRRDGHGSGRAAGR